MPRAFARRRERNTRCELAEAFRGPACRSGLVGRAEPDGDRPRLRLRRAAAALTRLAAGPDDRPPLPPGIALL